MPQTINTNVASLNAQRNLNASQSEANTALQRLSSGLRINSAKDDAAGLAIANRLTAQINGINQAIRNAGDGISVAQVAEGALSETGNILQRIRELAVQSANSSNSSEDRAALQSEVTQLTAEIDRIANNTAFGSSKLLNGSFTSQQFQVGANVGETIGVSVASAKSSDIGQVNNVSFTNFKSAQVQTPGAAVDSIVAAQNLTFEVGGASTVVAVAENASAKDIANSVSSEVSGVQASATTTAKITAGTNMAYDAGDTMAITVNGVSLGAIDVGADFATFVDNIKSAIDGDSSLSSSITATDNTTDLTLVDTDGDDITIELGALVNAGVAGTVAVVDLDVASMLSDGSLGTQATALLTNTRTTVTGDVDFTTSASDTTVLTLESSVTGAGTVQSAASGDMTGTDSGDRVSDVDISTVNGANSAISLVDAALTEIDSQRADLGAIQNRFDSVIANLSNVSENSAAARSRIQDADFAQETANLARAQILQQAGISVLAQANAQPQNVLALLQ
jgi:flagellin